MADKREAMKEPTVDFHFHGLPVILHTEFGAIFDMFRLVLFRT